MPFGMLSWVDLRNHVLHGGTDPAWEGQFWGARHARRHSDMNCAIMAELIETPFGLWARMGPRSMYYMEPRSPCKWAVVRGKDMVGHPWRHSSMSCAKMAEPIDLLFGLWSCVGRRKHKFTHIRQLAPMCPHGRAHWRHLANMIEQSVFGRYAALCQITLTTCFHVILLQPS